MGRKSSVDRLPPQVKAHLNRRLREGRLTLDELIADLRTTFPDQAGQGELPSRSALHRHSVGACPVMGPETSPARLLDVQFDLILHGISAAQAPRPAAAPRPAGRARRVAP